MQSHNYNNVHKIAGSWLHLDHKWQVIGIEADCLDLGCLFFDTLYQAENISGHSDEGIILGHSKPARPFPSF